MAISRRPLNGSVISRKIKMNNWNIPENLEKKSLKETKSVFIVVLNLDHQKNQEKHKHHDVKGSNLLLSLANFYCITMLCPDH